MNSISTVLVYHGLFYWVLNKVWQFYAHGSKHSLHKLVIKQMEKQLELAILNHTDES